MDATNTCTQVPELFQPTIADQEMGQEPTTIVNSSPGQEDTALPNAPPAQAQAQARSPLTQVVHIQQPR